jgi:type VI secretion system protein ImpA
VALSERMSSPETLDFESLLAPIPGDNPGGEALRYAGPYDAIEQARRADDQLTQGDWQRETKAADWRGVVELTTEALAKRSKDIQIAAWLAEALVRLHGFAGLRDGCRLVRELVDGFWDCLYPEIDEGDLESRAAPLEWMNQRLPETVRFVPMARSSRGDQYGWWHWQESRTVDNLGRTNPEARTAALAEGKIAGEDFDKAVATQRRAHYETLFADVTEAATELEALDRSVDDHFGRSAPSLVALKQAAEECRGLAEAIVKRKRELEPDAMPAGATSPAAGVASAAGSVDADGGMLRDRAAALRQLSEVAAFFRRTEPHSPVSYLVQRAVQWGHMPLEQWLQEVIKDETVLGHLRDTLGLKPPESSPAGDGG